MDIRYLAGLIDGEGCIGIYRKWKNKHKDASYVALLVLGMKNQNLLERIRAEYGGALSRNRVTGAWHLQWQNEEAMRLVGQCLPHLIIKRQLANLCVLFEKMRAKEQANRPRIGACNFGSYSPFYHQFASYLAAKSKQLIKRQYR